MLKILILFIFIVKPFFSFAQDTLLEYYPNKTLKTQGFLDNDSIKSGLWKLFFETGKLKGVVNFKNNKEHGPFAFFYSNGRISETGFNKNNIIDSLYTAHYPNGNIQISGYYESGKKDRTWKYYYESEAGGTYSAAIILVWQL